MSDIQVGDWIRTLQGTIAKIEDTEFDIKYNLQGQTLYENWIEGNRYYEIITKHSPNIVDIIEDEDIVILEYYVSNYRKRIQRIFEIEISGNDIIFLNHRASFLYDKEKQKFFDGKGLNPKIKAIVTKEQFNSVMYKVKE